MQDSTGTFNTAIGAGSGSGITTGSFNTSVGCATYGKNDTGGFNTTLGYAAGDYDTDGSYNTYLGAGSGGTGFPSGLYSVSTAIGYDSRLSASHQIVLGYQEGVYIPGGYLKIGSVTAYNPSSGYALYVDGSANFTNGINAASCSTASDYRIKENVTKLNDTFVVDNLNPVTYTNTITLKQDVGFIAHELQEVYPFLVNGIKDGEQFQSVNYIGLIGILTKEIQEIKERVKILEEK